MSAALAIVAALAGAYALLQAAALVWNRYLALPPAAPFPPVQRLLVVAPHQDDETIMAGGLMHRLARAGADIRVIMVTDGTPGRPDRPETQADARRHARNAETRAALDMVGVAERDIVFLGIPAEQGLRDPATIRVTVDRLAAMMADWKPDAIVAPAFEAGHPDHDATNYIVTRAARRVNLPPTSVYECCEYNGYFLSAGIFQRLNRAMVVRFDVPPRFIPGRNLPMRLDMSPAELAQKRAALRCYSSQKPDNLIRLFGYPDQFRVVEAHDYACGPYDPARTLRYRFCRILGRAPERCNPFNYGISLAGYARLYGPLESSSHAA